jgi:hypothetical protein
LQTPAKWLNRLGTFLIISFLWCFFVWPDTMTALKSVASVFTVFNYPEMISGIGTLGLGFVDWIVMLLASAVLWLYDWKRRSLHNKFQASAPAMRVAVICVLALAVLVLGMYGIGFEAEAFIYSRF